MSILRSIYFKSGLVAAALPALLLVPRTGSLQAQSFQPPPTGGGSGSYFAEDPAAMLEDLQLVRKVAKVGIEELDRSSFDPAALVGKLGNDRATLHSWVLANTQWLPYQGALRGAGGVLQDRGGSHLDRALLLGTMLQVAGIEGQILRGTLPEEMARNLLLKSIAASNTEDKATTDAKDDSPDADASGQSQQFQSLLKRVRNRGVRVPAGIEAKLDAQRLRAEQLQEVQIGTTVQCAERLRAQLDWPSLAGNTQSAEFAPTADEVRAFQDACWFRVQDGDDAVDLSLLPGGVTPADAGIEDSTLHSLAEVPDADAHRVRIRVSIERAVDQALEEAIVLDHEFAPHASAGELLSFRCQPTGVDADPNRSELENLRALADATDWIPVLRHGDEQIVQKGFDLAGNINEAPMAFATQGALVGATRMLDSLGGNAPAGQGECTALHLDYIVTTPIGAAEHRRTLFDLVGPAARTKGAYEAETKKQQEEERGFTLLGVSNILVSGSKPSSAVQVFETLTALEQVAQTAIGFIASMQAGSTEKMAKYSGEFPTVSPLLRNVQNLRHHGSPVDASTVVVSPQIFTSHESCRVRDNRLTRIDATDIVCNELAVFGIDAEQARTARLMQGVADTVAERLALGGNGRSNVVAWEQQLASDKEAWVLLRTAEDVAAATLPADDATRIERAIAKGAVVRAPSTDANAGELGFAWWRIDPQTGTCLGIGDRGWGQEMTEYSAADLEVIRNMTPWYRRFGATMICLIAVITARMILILATSGVGGAAGTAAGGPFVGAGVGALIGAIIGNLGLPAKIAELVRASAACAGA